jgi:hypothetical protein
MSRRDQRRSRAVILGAWSDALLQGIIPILGTLFREDATLDLDRLGAQTATLPAASPERRTMTSSR